MSAEHVVLRHMYIREHFEIQKNFNGSNTFGTMKISLRHGLFEPMRVVKGTRSGGIIGMSFRFSLT